MNFDKLLQLVMRLSAMKFFPTIPHAHVALAKMAGSMAQTEEQVEWLINRMVNLYDEWPGPREMRAVFCAKFKPKDGLNISGSAVFLDGIPPERIEQAPVLALAAGKTQDEETLSDDPELEARVRRLAEILSMQRQSRKRSPVFSSLTVITQADVDREVEKMREARARGELNGDGTN